jgi:hypothetical protein
LQIMCRNGYENAKENCFFGILLGWEIIVTFVLDKLQSSCGVCMQRNQMLFFTDM